MDVINSDEERSEQSSNPEIDLLFQENLRSSDQEERDKIKDYIAKKLRRYQGRKLSNKDFRILQGVLSTNFGRKEFSKKVKKER